MSMNAHQGVVPEWTAADRLIKARQHAGLTQGQIAHRLGISERTVKRYEASGERKRGIILGWAMVCGVNARWLETGEHTPGDNGPDLGSTHSGCNEITPLRPRRPRETDTYRAPTRRAS